MTKYSGRSHGERLGFLRDALTGVRDDAKMCDGVSLLARLDELAVETLAESVSLRVEMPGGRFGPGDTAEEINHYAAVARRSHDLTQDFECLSDIVHLDKLLNEPVDFEWVHGVVEAECVSNGMSRHDSRARASDYVEQLTLESYAFARFYHERQFHPPIVDLLRLPAMGVQQLMEDIDRIAVMQWVWEGESQGEECRLGSLSVASNMLGAVDGLSFRQTLVQGIADEDYFGSADRSHYLELVGVVDGIAMLAEVLSTPAVFEGTYLHAGYGASVVDYVAAKRSGGAVGVVGELVNLGGMLEKAESVMKWSVDELYGTEANQARESMFDALAELDELRANSEQLLGASGELVSEYARLSGLIPEQAAGGKRVVALEELDVAVDALSAAVHSLK